MLNSNAAVGGEFSASLRVTFLSSPTYNPTKKPYLKLPRKMQLLYHNLVMEWRSQELGVRDLELEIRMSLN